MSFLWHGLTEQGAQVPVQVDAQGRVIAVDGTPGVSNWDRTNGVLSPAVPTDSVYIGGTLPSAPNIILDASGSATLKGLVQTRVGTFTSPTDTSYTPQLQLIKTGGSGLNSPYARFDVGRYKQDGSVNQYSSLKLFVVNTAAGDAGAEFLFNGDGSATFAGDITANNVTFRSADSKFYVQKSKNKDALPEYVGPELDLLAEIARLESLVRHLYETLRLTPPAGWPVWDGNDDVLRQIRQK